MLALEKGRSTPGVLGDMSINTCPECKGQSPAEYQEAPFWVRPRALLAACSSFGSQQQRWLCSRPLMRLSGAFWAEMLKLL